MSDQELKSAVVQELSAVDEIIEKARLHAAIEEVVGRRIAGLDARIAGLEEVAWGQLPRLPKGWSVYAEPTTGHGGASHDESGTCVVMTGEGLEVYGASAKAQREPIPREVMMWLLVTFPAA